MNSHFVKAIQTHSSYSTLSP